MSISDPTPKPSKPVTIARAADHFGVTDATIRNWIGKWHLHVYRVPNFRAGLVDLDEIQSVVGPRPTTRRRRRNGTYNGAVVVDLPPTKPRAVVVPEADQ